MSSRRPPLTSLLAEATLAASVEPQSSAGIEATMQPAPHSPLSLAQAISMSGSDQDALAFDRWLRHELSRLYDPILHEPVPDHLRRLLDIARRGETPGH